MKSIAIQLFTVAGILSLGLSKIGFGRCPDVDVMPEYTYDTFKDEIGPAPGISYYYEHYLHGLDEGFLKTKSIISKVLGFDFMCEDFAKINPFKAAKKHDDDGGWAYSLNNEMNYHSFFEDWLNLMDNSEVRWWMLAFDYDTFQDYHYICIDSRNTAAWYKLMGEIHPKGSFFFDVSSFFARIAHAANVFEFATLKYHGGFVIGEDYFIYDKSNVLRDNLIDDFAFRIPGYNFKENVKFYDRSSCPDTCDTDPCGGRCYCYHLDNIDRDTACQKCDECNLKEFPDNWFGKANCYCDGDTADECDASACKADPTAAGCYCNADYFTANVAGSDIAEAYWEAQCGESTAVPADWTVPVFED